MGGFGNSELTVEAVGKNEVEVFVLVGNVCG